MIKLLERSIVVSFRFWWICSFKEKRELLFRIRVSIFLGIGGADWRLL